MVEVLSIFDKVGTKIDENLSNKNIEDIFSETKLNWEVDTEPLFYYTDNEDFKCTNYNATMRKDTKQILGVVGENYKVVQNKEAFNFIDSLDGFTYEHVGCSPDSKKVWVTGKLNETFYIDKSTNDNIDVYATFVHGHDGKFGIKMCITPIRLFCRNQLNYFFKDSYFVYSISHLGDVQNKIKHIHNQFNRVHVYLEKLQKEIANQIRTKISNEEIKDILNNMFNFNIKENEPEFVKERRKEKINNIIKLYNDKDDLQNYKGTAFGFISAISDYVSHIEPIRQSAGFYTNTFLKQLNGNNLIEQARSMIKLAA